MFHFLAGLDDPIHRDQKLCHSHQEHLIEVAILNLVGLAVLNSMYKLANVLRNSGLFQRLHGVAYQTIQGMVVFRQKAAVGPAPMAGRQYASELCQYLLVNAGLRHENTNSVLEAAATLNEYDEDDDSFAHLSNILPEDLLDPDECQKTYMHKGSCLFLFCWFLFVRGLVCSIFFVCYVVGVVCFLFLSDLVSFYVSLFFVF